MKQCEICQKGSQMGSTRTKLRGKYNPTNKKRKYPNLQWLATPAGGRVKACTKCLRNTNKPAKKA